MTQQQQEQQPCPQMGTAQNLFVIYSIFPILLAASSFSKKALLAHAASFAIESALYIRIVQLQIGASLRLHYVAIISS